MLLGARDENETRQMMKDVVAFETEIANVTIPAEDRRDDEKMYHAMNLTELQKLSAAVTRNMQS